MADQQEYKGKLLEMRKILRKQRTEKVDLGMFPECVWLEEGKDNPSSYGARHRSSVRRYLDIADLELCGSGNIVARKRVCRALESEDPVERYWGATVCASWGEKASFASTLLSRLMQDAAFYVSSRAIVAMMRLQEKALAEELLGAWERAKRKPV